MCGTCFNVHHMSKMIQIRNVPDEIHRTLKTRAAQEGKSLSDYILGELRKSAEVPTMAEMLERIRNRPPVEEFSTEEAVRAERDSRGLSSMLLFWSTCCCISARPMSLRGNCWRLARRLTFPI